MYSDGSEIADVHWNFDQYVIRFPDIILYKTCSSRQKLTSILSRRPEWQPLQVQLQPHSGLEQERLLVSRFVDPHSNSLLQYRMKPNDTKRLCQATKRSWTEIVACTILISHLSRNSSLNPCIKLLRSVVRDLTTIEEKTSYDTRCSKVWQAVEQQRKIYQLRQHILLEYPTEMGPASHTGWTQE